jgi:hypothetical protein
MGTPSITYIDQYNVMCTFTNTVIVPVNGSLEVTINNITNPGCTAPVSGFTLITGDKDKNASIFTDLPTVATSTPGTATGSVSRADGQDGIL